MIYDEGFEINIADYSFFTFSKYESDNVEFKSVCDQTLVGWYNNNGKKGCYKGYKPTGDGKATENTK